MQHGAALVQFRPVMASEIPDEWNLVSPRQEAEAKRQLGVESVTGTVCLELPDIQAFREYARWTWNRHQHAPGNEVPVAIMAMDSYRWGGQDAQMGRPALHWMCTWAPRDVPTRPVDDNAEPTTDN